MIDEEAATRIRVALAELGWAALDDPVMIELQKIYEPEREWLEQAVQLALDFPDLSGEPK